jgi:AcrR family transcriptional regulator
MSRPRQTSDDQLLQAARECFLQHGAAVSTTVIANHVGVSQAVLFQRFGTKEALLLRALLPGQIPWVDRLEEGPDARPLLTQLREHAHAIFAWFKGVAPHIAVLRASGVDLSKLCEQGEEPAPVRGLKALTRWIERAQREGRTSTLDPASAAELLLGALHSRVFLRHLCSKMPAEAPGGDTLYVDMVVEVLWKSLRPGGKR